MTPYYQSADGRITVYHARWEAVHAAGLVPLREVKLVHADPAYGVNERTERATAGRVGKTGSGGVDPRRLKAHDFPRVHGDDQPFDPAPLLALDRPLVTWGANHYCSRLPGSPSWITWDKREDTTPDDNADGEHAWSSLGGPARIFRHLWRGTCRASETGTPHLGPTQKPIALSVYIGERGKMRQGDLLFVPYLGTGPDLAAAYKLGWRVIACDVDRHWCEVACSARLGVITSERAAEPCGPLFGGAS